MSSSIEQGSEGEEKLNEWLRGWDLKGIRLSEATPKRAFTSMWRPEAFGWIEGPDDNYYLPNIADLYQE